MKKITYFFNKAGRTLSKREKQIVYKDNDILDYPDSVLAKTEIKDLTDPISYVKIGDVVRCDYHFTTGRVDAYDIVSDVDLNKGVIRLKWNNSLKFSLEDGHGLSNAIGPSFIAPETDSNKIEEIKKEEREIDLRDEIGDLLDDELLYSLGEEDLKKILDILKKNLNIS